MPELLNPKILIALGSPSDKRLLSQISLDESVDLYLSIASAHRTPAKVGWHSVAQDWNAIIVSAGLTNALLSEYVKHAKPETLVFGVPITDDATNGLSSILSSQELPQGYVSAIVGLEDMHKAVNTAKKLITNKYDKVCLHYFNDLPKKAEEFLAKVGVQYRVQQMNDIKKIVDGELALAIGDIKEVKEMFGCGTVIASITNTPTNPHEKLRELASYLDNLSFNPNTLFVGFNNQVNLALFGAKVISRKNPFVAEQIRKYIEDGKKKYEPFKDVIQLTHESLKKISCR